MRAAALTIKSNSAVRLGVAMRMRSIAGTVLFMDLVGAVFGLSAPSTTKPAEAATKNSAAATAPARFEIADIHTSPRRRYPFFEGAFLQDGRYIVRQATMVDLIRTAYGLQDSSYVHGGPSWLEWYRWDVIGEVPPGASDATAKQMLQSLLVQRFGLVIRTGNAPMPAYVLTAPKGKDKLKESDGAGDTGCKPQPPANQAPGAITQILVTCHNETMEQFAEDVHSMAGGYLTDPVVDSTALKGAYDFDLKWTPRGLLPRAGSEGISIFDAVSKELGLKLSLETAPRPVQIVESLNETPTPNVPDLGKIMPPLPPAQFEVATIKPSAPDEKQDGRISGDEVNVHAFPLRTLINLSWDLDANDRGEIVGAPKWLDSDKIDVEAKVATSNLSEGAGPGRPSIAFDDLREMLKALLIDRFEMKVRMEDQAVDSYELVAEKPKLTPADPKSRTNCHIGPGPDGKDPRTTSPILNMLLTCQNVTIDQAVEEFPHFAAYYLYYPPVDKTGLKSGWDFTLNWSSGDNMPGFNGGGGQPQSESGTASEPNGALSFYDAVSKELGLKLVKIKRPEPVLVIDHIDEQPTPN
jgi:uncharacterized protein (TIGR03435 family)